MNELEDELRRLADSITPDTNFAANLEQALLKGQKEKKMLRLSRLRRYGLGFVAGLGMLVALTLAVPPLRTLAQEIIDSLFNQLDSDTTTQSYTRVEPDTTQNAEIEFSSIREAELSVQGRINLVEPSFIPEEYNLTSVTLNSNIRPEIREGMYFSSINYERRQSNQWMTLNVMQSSPDLDWGFAGDVGASATITPVRLEWGSKHIEADYVEGSWIKTEENTDDNNVTEVYEWDSNVPVRRLSWLDTQTLYIIQAVGLNPQDSGYIGQEEMVRIAESMYANSLALGGGMYSSFEDAEMATGVDLPQLPDLTKEYRLESVIVLPDPLYIQFQYEGEARSMTITRSIEDQATSNEIGASADIIPVTLNWNGREITAEYIEGGWMEKSRSENGDKTRHNLKWDSSIPFQILRWQDNGMIYEIAASHSVDHPGLELSELTRIAEGLFLENVAFEGNFFITIEDAEASVGMDIPEPQGIPCYYCLKRVTADGESFELVYADGYELIISRKLSHFKWRSTTDIGASAEIIPVQLQWGNEQIEGEYVRGGWVVAGGAEPKITKTEETETRELDWENDLPVQALRWQQGEFRYEVYVKGGSPDRNWVSREAMIEIAESLY